MQDNKNDNTIDVYLKKLREGTSHQNLKNTIHHSDMANYLEGIKKEDEEEFFTLFNTLPISQRAHTFLELPTARRVLI